MPQSKKSSDRFQTGFVSDVVCYNVCYPIINKNLSLNLFRANGFPIMQPFSILCNIIPFSVSAITEDESMAGGPNSTFEGDDATSPPTTAVGAGDNNTLSPILSPTSDTEHTTGTNAFTNSSFLRDYKTPEMSAEKKSLNSPPIWVTVFSYLLALISLF